MFKKILSNFFKLVQQNYITILIFLLFFVYATTIFYKDVQFLPNMSIPSTESRLNSYFTNDFFTSVYFRANQMIKGQEMNVLALYPEYVDSASGQLFPLLFSPLLYLKGSGRFVLYSVFLFFAAIIFILFYVLLMKKSGKEIFNGGLIFIFAFLISEPGFIGIYMGNTDIVLAPIMGTLILLVINSNKNELNSLTRTILLGILAGALMNAKIFLFPFAVLAVIYSKRSFLTGLVSFLTFMALIYAPNLFGSQSSLASYFSKVISWDSYIPFSTHLWGNHSLYAIASFFSGCIDSAKCNNQVVYIPIVILLFLFTFLVPFLISRPFKKNFFKGIGYSAFLKLRKNKSFIIVLLVISVAFINLAFRVVYDYRLFYSLVISLILLKESTKLKNASTYCYLSMFSLLLGGIWALKLNPNEPWTIDARLIKFFIIFHFFFLILSSIYFWKESGVKSTGKFNEIKRRNKHE